MKHEVNCGCLQRAEQMNAWGVAGCRAARADIVAWMKANQDKYKWTSFVTAAAKAVTTGVAWRLSLLDEESIKSIQRRAAKVAPADKLAEHQRWLEEGRQSILQNAADVLRIGYAALLNDPERELQRVVEWLDIEPTAEQMAAAVAHVKPGMRHVTSGEAA